MNRATWQPELLSERTPSTAITWRQVVTQIAPQYHVTVESVLSRDRHKNVAKARRHSWWKLRELTGLSWPEIARATGYDHSTCIQQVRAFALECGLSMPDVQKRSAKVECILTQARRRERLRLIEIVQSMPLSPEERCVAAKIVAALR